MSTFFGLVGFIGFLAVIYFIVKRNKAKPRGTHGEFRPQPKPKPENQPPVRDPYEK